MTPVCALGIALIVVISAKTFAWVVSLKTGNAGLVDPIWSFTLGSLAVLFACLGTAPLPLKLLLAALGGLWGFRLGYHLFKRNWGKEEDWRYAQFREKWGAHANRNMFLFFQFQNVFTLLLAGTAFLPVAFNQNMPSLPLMALAVAIWLVSVVGEGIADTQMERFRGNPANKGQVCNTGLWRYSRHPNYFFESVHWAAYIPLALCASHSFGWISLFAPLIMAWLLIKFSGVPLLEKEMTERKPGYAEYVRKTSAFIPWPPKD